MDAQSRGTSRVQVRLAGRTLTGTAVGERSSRRGDQTLVATGGRLLWFATGRVTPLDGLPHQRTARAQETR